MENRNAFFRTHLRPPHLRNNCSRMYLYVCDKAIPFSPTLSHIISPLLALSSLSQSQSISTKLSHSHSHVLSLPQPHQRKVKKKGTKTKTNHVKKRHQNSTQKISHSSSSNTNTLESCHIHYVSPRILQVTL